MANQDILRRAVRYALMVNASAIAAVPAAFAQEANGPAQPPATATAAATPTQEVIVTGSRIIEPGLTSVSPVATVAAPEIRASGATRIEDMLNALPQVMADQGAGVSNGATGEATVNLRGLGVQRTLVLINGRRLMPGDPAPPQLNGFSAADLNNIPAALVDRVDILTGGASSVYGADAVAGVVNFVMNDHFQGLKLDLNTSIYQHGQQEDWMQQTVKQANYALPASNVWDGNSKDFAVIFGKNFADNTGNFTSYVTYRRVSAILEAARDFSSCQPTLDNASPTGWSCTGSSTSYPGRFVILPPGKGNFTIGPGGFIPFTNADKYNFAPSNYFQRPDERWTAGDFLHLDLTDKIRLYQEFMFMDDATISQIAPGGSFFGQGTAVDANNIPNGAMQTNCDNPLLNGNQLAALCPQPGQQFAQFLLGRRDVEGGDRINDLEHTAFRVVLGVKGQLTDAFSYDTYFQEGRTQYQNFTSGNFSKTNLTNALNVKSGPNGPVCVTTAPGCVPYNIWSIGGVTPDALKYVEIPSLQQGFTEERIWDGNITADLGKYVKVPGADSGLLVNFGSEYRSEAAVLHVDAPNVNFDVSGNGSPIEPLDAYFHVWEGFVEAGMPFVTDKPFAKELSAEFGYRYSSYTEGFTTNTYKFGLNWAPTSDVRLRASYNRAVRAPNLQELFTQKVLSLEGSYDPCAGSTTGSPTASLAQCMLTGVTAAQYGTLIPNSAGQYQGLVGGNPTLQPETADTTSFGVVFTPGFVPNLNVTLDYFHIRIKNVITSYGFPLQLTQCLDTGNPYFCGQVHRDVLGSLWIAPTGYVDDPTLNLGALEARGVDLTATYRLDLAAAGRLDFRFFGSYNAQLITEPGGQLGLARYDCAGYFGATCNAPAPKWKHKLLVNYETPFTGLGVGLTWRYIGQVTQDAYSPNPLLNGGPGFNSPPQSIASYQYFDLNASYALNKNVSVRVGVNNVMDKDPPFVSVGYFSSAFVNGNTYSNVYDFLGRYLFANLTLQF